MTPPIRTPLLSPVLTAFGLFFVFGVIAMNRLWPSGWAWEPEQPAYLHMIFSIYVTLGIFLLLAARHPARHLSLIWFTIWSSLAHGTAMAWHAVAEPGQIGHLWGDVAALYLTSVVLTVLVRHDLPGARLLEAPAR